MLLPYLTDIDGLEGTPHPMLSVRFDCFVQNSKEKTADHGAYEASYCTDAPDVKKDDLVVTSMKVHHHHVVHGRRNVRGMVG